MFFFLPIWVDFSTLIQRLLEIRVDFFKKSTLMWRLLMIGFVESWIWGTLSPEWDPPNDFPKGGDPPDNPKSPKISPAAR